MNDLHKTLLLILLLSVVKIYSGNIVIKGPSPYGLKKEVFEKEYGRLYSTLNPGKDIDTSVVTVEYYKSHNELSRPTLPEWGGGGAIGKNKIVIPIDKKAIYKKNSAVTISHELTHIAINRICDKVKVPRFFHEGVAMYLSGDISLNEQSALSMALFTQSLIPLLSIDSVNYFSQSRAQLAYAQSRLTVDYLVKNYDREVLSLILKSSIKNGDFEIGLKDELDISIHQLDSLSRSHIAQTYSNLFWIIDNYILWISILLLFLTAYILTIIRNRRKMKALEEADRLEEERLASLEDSLL